MASSESLDSGPLRVIGEPSTPSVKHTTFFQQTLPRIFWRSPVLFAIAFLLRLPGSGRPAVGDENFAVGAVERTLEGIVQELVSRDAHPPLYFFLLQLWGLVSQELWWLRMLSVILGALTCVLVYQIGSVAFGRDVARYAFLFVTLSPLLIFISQYLRSYALSVFLSAAIVFIVIRILQAEESRTFLTRLAVYMVLLVLAVYTFYGSFFFVLGINLFLLGYYATREPRRLAPVVLSLVIAGAAYLPWLPLQIAQMERVYSGVSASTPVLKSAKIGLYVGEIHLGALAKAFFALLQLDDRYTSAVRFTAQYPASWLAVGALAGAVAILTLIIAGSRRLKAIQRIDGFVYMVVIVSVLPPLAASALSVAGDLGLLRPIAVNLRYFGESAAMFTLLIAGSAASLRPRILGRAAGIGICLILAVQLPYLYRYPFNDQSRVFKILDQYPDTRLAISFPMSVEEFLDAAGREEFRRRYEHLVLSHEREEHEVDARIEEEIEAITRHDRFVYFQVTIAEWLILLPASFRHFESVMNRHSYFKAQGHRLSDILTVEVYERRASASPGPRP